MNEKTGTAPTEYYGHCPKCGELLGFGHLPEKSKCPTCGSIWKPSLTCCDAWHDSDRKHVCNFAIYEVCPICFKSSDSSTSDRCPTCESDDRQSRDIGIIRGEERECTDPWHESKPIGEQTERKGFTRDDDGNEVHFTKRMVTMKPTSEGAREWIIANKGEAFDEDHGGPVIYELMEAYAASLRSQLAAAEQENKRLGVLVGLDKYPQFKSILEVGQALLDANAELQRLRERLKSAQQEVVEAVALRDKWINYAFVGEVVPPLAGNVLREEPTIIEEHEAEIQRLRERITELEGSKDDADECEHFWNLKQKGAL